MKIALVNPFSFTYQGGVQEHVKELYTFLKERRQDVKVIAPRQNREEDYGPDFLLLGSSIVIPGNDSRVSLSYCLPFEAAAVIRREKFDLLHFHSFLPFMPFQILNGLKGSRAVKIMTSHSNIEGSFFATALGGITEFVIDSFVSQMDGVICVSTAARELVKNFNGLTAIIPNGINLKKFNQCVGGRREFRDGKVNLLFVGRVDHRKGLQILLPAFAALRRRRNDLRLIVVGDGFLRAELEAKVHQEKIPDVVFAGEVKASETPPFYAVADIFCAPSIRGETFGIILLEAMASGVPVLASDIAGYREVMPKAAGTLCPPGDIAAWEAEIEKLINEPRRRQQLVEVGLSHAKKYDWASVGPRILTFYQEVETERKNQSVGKTLVSPGGEL